MNSRFPIYKTSNGTLVRAYVAEAAGKTLSVDGGEDNYRGKDGMIGSYFTAEGAIGAAQKEKSATCNVKVTDIRAENGQKVIFEQ